MRENPPRGREGEGVTSGGEVLPHNLILQFREVVKFHIYLTDNMLGLSCDKLRQSLGNELCHLPSSGIV